jgi:quercetin dioxygenase-like cupin family protein
MKSRLLTVVAFLSLFAGPSVADPSKEVMNIVREPEIRWVEATVARGASTAILEGDPKVAGKVYVQRVRFSPGTFSPPHFHPENRYIVVLKGTWWVGEGPIQDKSKTTPVPAGSLVVHHAGKIHWDGAKDEEVILQITGIGPGVTIPVDENGQPRKP